MNIIEAVRSGHPFRRKAWGSEWKWSSPYSWSNNSFLKEDILADDWEIQEPAVSLTKRQLYEAYAQALKDVEDAQRFFQPKVPHSNLLDRMLEHLGFKP